MARKTKTKGSKATPGRGRPSKYKTEFCDKIIELARIGKTQQQWAAELGVDNDTIQEWAAVHEDFSVAKRQADALCQNWWIEQARVLSQNTSTYIGKRSEVAVLIFALKNIAKWRDKSDVEVSGKDGKPMQTQVSWLDIIPK